MITNLKINIMNRKILILAVGLMITVNLTAQNSGQEFIDRMNHIFQYVDKNKVTTGLLSDYGLQMVEPAYFNGVPADPERYAGIDWYPANVMIVGDIEDI